MDNELTRQQNEQVYMTRATRIITLATEYVNKGMGVATAFHQACKDVPCAVASINMARRLWARTLADRALATQVASKTPDAHGDAIRNLLQAAECCHGDDAVILYEASDLLAQDRGN